MPSDRNDVTISDEGMSALRNGTTGSIRLLEDAAREMEYRHRDLRYAVMYGGNPSRLRTQSIEREQFEILKLRWNSMSPEQRREDDDFKDELVNVLYDLLDNGDYL